MSRAAFKGRAEAVSPISPKDELRRSTNRALASALGTFLVFGAKKSPAIATIGSDINNPPPTPPRGFQSKTGLKYFDFKEGEYGNSPRYGQLVTFHYAGYYRPSPESPLELFDSSYLNPGKTAFLHKHGNGRVLRGIDEGLHTMKVGGKRRLIIPKTIGFSEFGVGPVPTDPFRRRRLGKILDFIEADQGELIYDVELLMVADDENDQGYYDDVAITQEEVRKMVLKSMNLDTTIIDAAKQKKSFSVPDAMK
jgi:hypothetical protein